MIAKGEKLWFSVWCLIRPYKVFVAFVGDTQGIFVVETAVWKTGCFIVIIIPENIRHPLAVDVIAP